MRVVSKGDLAVLIASALIIGAAAVTIAQELAYKSAPGGADPVQIEHTPSSTIARFQTVIEGTPAACVLTLDHKTRTYRVLCTEVRRVRL